MLNGRKILLGVCGGIAAYKIALLARLLIKSGAEVRVLMTNEAKSFVSPLTLATLSKNPVLSELYDPADGSWNNHVDLGMWADLMLIAPATANSLAKMRAGLADNLLLTTFLSARCPVFAAPAMDLDMWQNPATQSNIAELNKRGVKIIKPESGELASGLSGMGRMPEPAFLFQQISLHFEGNSQTGSTGLLAGKKVLITAGGTRERIDPVRFIGNHSTGKMGFALAENLANNGAEVTLVTGPTVLKTENSGINRIDVESAEQMYQACIDRFDKSDIYIGSAAVADFTPVHSSDSKIKKEALASEDGLRIELKRTKDILGELGRRKKSNQILVGFALETNNEIENAKEKLLRKNLDFIILNSLRDKGAGFKGDTNKVTIIAQNNKISSFELKSKVEVASDIINYLVDYMHHPAQ